MAVTAFEIKRREPVLGGRAFTGPGGAAIAYEKVAGTLRFAVDPAHAANAAIADLALAERDARGRVAFSADAYLLRPAEAGRGSRRLLLDVANRGRKMALSLFNSTPRSNDPSTEADFGNGFLMRHGWTVAWVGWQHDVPRQDGMIAMDVPVARAAGGAISGRRRCQWRPNAPVDVLPLADRYHHPHPAADLDDPEAELTVREHAGAPASAVARSAWRFARREGDRLVADARHLHLAGGFRVGAIYQLAYRVEDPLLIGLGFAAVRDTASFLRWGSAEEGNPCAGSLDRAHVFGISQSGRLLRHLLYLGLDEDEAGRLTFDGVMPHVAGARRGEFNLRFGQSSLNATGSVGSLFPFTDVETVDAETGARGALLGRLAARGRAPKIMTINSSAEYWRGDASLVHTDPAGRADVAGPAGTRVYLHAGTQHTPGTIPPAAVDPNTGDRGQQLFNAVDYTPLLRADLSNLDRWVAEGVEPPPSAVPRLADGSMVAHDAVVARITAIPGVRGPERVSRPARYDFGPDVERGIAQVPPKVGGAYPSFVSAVDADGNEIAGVRPVELRAPLATFLGWNLRHPEQGAPGDLMSMMGSTLPLPLDAAARAASGDPRRPVADRWPARADYLAAARAAADALCAERHLLAEDVEAVVERAGRFWDFVQGRAAGR
jgi:hypothetical protein